MNLSSAGLAALSVLVSMSLHAGNASPARLRVHKVLERFDSNPISEKTADFSIVSSMFNG